MRIPGYEGSTLYLLYENIDNSGIETITCIKTNRQTDLYFV